MAQATGLPCVVSDTVSYEANLTNLVKFIALNQSVESWSDLILDSIADDRDIICSIAKELLKEQHYDIKSCVNYLEEIYLNIAEGKVR